MGTEKRTAADARRATDPRVRLELLGGFRLRINSEPVFIPTNARRVLAFLALNDRPMLREHVAGSLWGETTDRHASGSLRSALSRLGATRAHVIETGSGQLQLTRAVSTDMREGVTRANRLLDLAHDLDDDDLDETPLSSDLLLDWTEEWVLLARNWYHELRIQALESLATRLTATHQLGRAARAGILAVTGEPLRESARRVLIVAYLAEGNTGSALREYQEFQQILHHEMDLEPSPQMQDLVRDIRR